MGIFDSFRKKASVPSQSAEPDKSAALQVLFATPLSDDAAHLQRIIRAYDPTLRGASVSLFSAGDDSRAFLGQVAWGAHRVEVVAFGLPMPAEVVETCVRPAAYGDEDKARAYAQQAHSLLYYKGSAANMTEQFIAVALVAAALCSEDGLAILNENARTSMPATLFTSEFTSDSGMSPTQFLRTLPPLYLFAGFVKYEIEDMPGVWMRTHGLDGFDLPNLATHAQGHEQSEEVFDIFCNVATYLMAQGPVLEAGHTMQIGDAQFMRLRELAPEEVVLDDGQPLLVAEFIRADQANSHIFGSDQRH